VAPEEERTSAFTVLIELPAIDADGEPVVDDDRNAIMELWFVPIIATCMNMVPKTLCDVNSPRGTRSRKSRTVISFSRVRCYRYSIPATRQK
jgi:hypothetical protein